MKPTRSLPNWLFLCLAGVGLTFAAGCVSTPVSDGTELRLAMTAAGTVLFEGNAVDSGALPGVLKSHRVAPDTPIVVAIPADEPMGVVKDLSRRLAAAGYRRVLFTRPKRADAAPSGRR